MRFGAIAVEQATGAVLVHTTRTADVVFKKGRVLRQEDVSALAAAGVSQVICAVLEAGDVMEDAAAWTIATHLAGLGTIAEPAKTGRCNLFATQAGLCTLVPSAIARVNDTDERITVATVANGTAVRSGDMVATVKIIPFSVPAELLTSAILTTNSADPQCCEPAIQIRPWLSHRAGLILTRFADTHSGLLDRAASAQRERMVRCGGEIVEQRIVNHEVSAMTDALRELAAQGLDPILALGASAIMDRRDVIPAALEAAGGTIVRFGMPVDPGNLLLLGTLPGLLGAGHVVGVPGCARSLKRSGFDWILERICAGITISSAEIASLGIGGLLDEIEQRPAPRQPTEHHASRSVAAIILAAGLGSRMGSAKLLEPLQGRPLIRWAAEAALASRARPVVVVIGHRGDEVAAALTGLPLMIERNPDYLEGMASSLRVGIARVTDADAAVVCLGDMPQVTGAHIDHLIAAFEPTSAPIVVPTHQRKRGNPVLWSRRFFAEIAELRGDVGARSLLDRYADQIYLLTLDDPAILMDVDTPQALDLLRQPSRTPP
jgi:molybdenum cofactor cytidylyltransferase